MGVLGGNLDYADFPRLNAVAYGLNDKEEIDYDQVERLAKEHKPKMIVAGASAYSLTFDWKRFYELGGASFLTQAKDYLRGRYDWVVIDSRTGVSDTSGICTIHLPDLLIVCFTANNQSIKGTAAIAESVREQWAADNPYRQARG